MENKVEIKHKGDKLVFVLKDLTWGDIKKIRKKSIVVQEHKGQPMQFRDLDLLEDLKIVRSVSSVQNTEGTTLPWEKTLENLDKLSEKSRLKLARTIKGMESVGENQQE